MSVRISQKIILGSRGSELARAQTALVARALQQAWPEIEVRIEIVKTRGDERSLETDRADRSAGRPQRTFHGRNRAGPGWREKSTLPCIARKICRVTERLDWNCVARFRARQWKMS